MNLSDLKFFATSDLINAFKEKARLIGSPSYMAQDPGHRPLGREQEEREEAELRILAEEIKARRPLAEVRALLNDESFAIRSKASARLGEIDESDLPSAAFQACLKGLQTRHVLALYELGRSRPPQRPTVYEMTSAQLVKRIEDSGLREWAVRDFVPHDSDVDGCAYNVGLANQAILEAHDAYIELDDRGDADQILPLLKHENAEVCCLAAAFCLDEAPDLAVPVLEAHPMIGGSTLSFWRLEQAGKIKTPPRTRRAGAVDPAKVKGVRPEIL